MAPKTANSMMDSRTKEILTTASLTMVSLTKESSKMGTYYWESSKTVSTMVS
jgi:hypothetical protein